MKRKGYILFFLFTSLFPLQAQSPEGDGEGLLFFEKIIICEGKEKEMLFQQLTEALSEIYDSINVMITNDYKIFTIGGFNVYNRLVGKVGNPAGRIDFNLTIDVKDEKFRYKATDFYFSPIEKDRYGRFKISDDQPVKVYEGDIINKPKPLLKKIKAQAGDYLAKLEKALTDHLMEEENKVEW